MTTLIAITVLMILIAVCSWAIVLLKKFGGWVALKRAFLELGLMSLCLLIYMGLAWVLIEVLF